MNEEEFMSMFLRRNAKGLSVIGVRSLPESLRNQIVHASLTAGFLGVRGHLEFRFEVDSDDELCWVEWIRGDDARTINLIADGTWFQVYCGLERTNVMEFLPEGGERETDVETMEAIMLIAGVHPSQL